MKRTILMAAMLIVAMVNSLSWSCAIMGPRNLIPVESEQAIVVWDAKTQTEHFIRRATFNTKIENFGFIVPTPAVPVLVDVGDSAFRYLEEVTKPKIEKRVLPPNALATAEMEPVNFHGVRQIAQTKLAGMDAVTLEADDPAQLAKWLAAHGYQSDAATEQWLKPYIEQHWKLTAFKIAKDREAASAVSTATIRMSFKADRLFYPYREPGDSPESEGRKLGVYVIADTRMQGFLGKKEWSASTMWSNKLNHLQAETLGVCLQLPQEIFEGKKLTVMTDLSTRRPSDQDLVFDRSPSAAAVTPPPKIVYVRQ